MTVAKKSRSDALGAEPEDPDEYTLPPKSSPTHFPTCLQSALREKVNEIYNHSSPAWRWRATRIAKCLFPYQCILGDGWRFSSTDRSKHTRERLGDAFVVWVFITFKWEESCSLKDRKNFLQKILGEILKAEKGRLWEWGLTGRKALSVGCHLAARSKALYLCHLVFQLFSVSCGKRVIAIGWREVQKPSSNNTARERQVQV